jgi:hypothetical protein
MPAKAGLGATLIILDELIRREAAAAIVKRCAREVDTEKREGVA